jgi:hypothetical protein
VRRTRTTGQTTRQGGRNFLRGVRGKPAIRDDGQTVLDSGGSRTHVAGSRLGAAGAQLRGSLNGGGGGGQDGSGGGRGGWDAHSESRNESFDNLRVRRTAYPFAQERTGDEPNASDQSRDLD